MMFLFKIKIDPESIPSIEDYLYELGEDCTWVIVQKETTDPFFLEGYFVNKADALIAWNELLAELIFLGYSNVSDDQYTLIEIHDRDWKEAYKEYVKPWVFQNLHWIPAWQKDTYPINLEDINVIVDAGMAFGSGCHETTRLCAMRIIEFFSAKNQLSHGLSVIDVGCGSGILAITAKKAGFAKVEGFDIDPEVMKVCEENLKINDLNSQDIHFYVSDIDSALKKRSADLILANILAPILINHSLALLEAIQLNGQLVLSGILASESDQVLSIFVDNIQLLNPKQFTTESNQLGEWVDIVIARVE